MTHTVQNNQTKSKSRVERGVAAHESPTHSTAAHKNAPGLTFASGSMDFKCEKHDTSKKQKQQTKNSTKKRAHRFALCPDQTCETPAPLPPPCVALLQKEKNQRAKVVLFQLSSARESRSVWFLTSATPISGHLSRQSVCKAEVWRDEWYLCKSRENTERVRLCSLESHRRRESPRGSSVFFGVRAANREQEHQLKKTQGSIRQRSRSKW